MDLYEFEYDLDEDTILEMDTIELEEVRCAADEWTAKAGKYKVCLKVDQDFDGEEIYDEKCTCGSKMPICAHIATLALRVQEHYRLEMILDEDLEGDIDFDIAKKVLKKLNKKELLDIAIEYSEYGDILARDLTVRYLKNDGNPVKYAKTFCDAIMKTIKVDLMVSERTVRDTKVGFAAIRVLGDQALEEGRINESLELQSICLEYLAQADKAASSIYTDDEISLYTEKEIDLLLDRFKGFLEMGKEDASLLKNTFKGIAKACKYFRRDSRQLAQLIRMLFPFCKDKEHAYAALVAISSAASLTGQNKLLDELEEISGLVLSFRYF